MMKNYILAELQRIQCDLSSGIKTLGQVELRLSEENLPNCYYDALYVVYTFIRGIHKDLVECIQLYEEEM